MITRSLDWLSRYLGRRYYKRRLDHELTMVVAQQRFVRELYADLDQLQHDYADELNRHRDVQPPTLKQHRMICDMQDDMPGDGELDITDHSITERIADDNIRWVLPISGRIRLVLAEKQISTPRGMTQ